MAKASGVAIAGLIFGIAATTVLAGLGVVLAIPKAKAKVFG